MSSRAFPQQMPAGKAGHTTLCNRHLQSTASAKKPERVQELAISCLNTFTQSGLHTLFTRRFCYIQKELLSFNRGDLAKMSLTSNQKKPTGSRLRKQALLIENSPLYHRFLSEQFAHLGYSSVIADSRQSALARLHAGNYQLICMNMYFEGGNAIELVKEIRRDDPSVVVIMLTSDKSRTLRSHALRAGVTEVIYKSGHKSISRQIARCLKHSRHVHLRGSKVMYVEDSLTQAVMNMQILEGMGLEITHFRTAEAAMASFRISDFDLVITDVLLKGEASGLTLLRHIRSLPGIGRRIPVLTITGYDDAARRQELFRAGTSDYITKPVLKEELVIRVSNLISNKLLADKVEGQQAELYDQVCLRPRDRFWDIPVPKIDSAFDNLLVPQPSWSPSTTQQLRKLVAAPYLPPNDWTPRLDAYFASPLALCARRVSSAASRLLGSTSLRFALHGWQRWR